MTSSLYVVPSLLQPRGVRRSHPPPLGGQSDEPLLAEDVCPVGGPGGHPEEAECGPEAATPEEQAHQQGAAAAAQDQAAHGAAQEAAEGAAPVVTAPAADQTGHGTKITLALETTVDENSMLL